jgi:hypothetical protein
MKSIEHLPDLAALRRVQAALWGQGDTRGAAVMVGAGLSRSALRASADAPPTPLWNELALEMALALNETHSPQDPLRLAEQFEAVLGRPALNELLRRRIDDPSLEPSSAHRRLVALPWTDILTTNWDTLLERSAREHPDREYGVVLTTPDIARTRSPRVVKLHGTFPSHLPFILTERDFRTYPTRFAPFVNLAQQVLLENALCLIGFSGDDPNFLAWSGWVRDHLGENAPTIYLAGALDLSPGQRRLLERRGVTPIDFTPILPTTPSAAEHHAMAVTILLDELENARPWPRHRWPEHAPVRNIEIVKDGAKPPQSASLPDRITQWRNTRSSYPGWVVAPFGVRLHLRGALREWTEVATELTKGSDIVQRQAAFELGWRFEVGLQTLPSPLVSLLEGAVRAPEGPLSIADRSQIALWLLRRAREQDNDDEFTRWLNWADYSDDIEVTAARAWEEALQARDRLDISRVEILIPTLKARDPMWDLRRAAMLSCINEDQAAFRAAVGALQDLRRRQALDRGSIWLASRRAWATFICSSANRLNEFQAPDDLVDPDMHVWPADLTLIGCNPYDEKRFVEDGLRREFDNRRRKRIDVRPSFDPGYSTVSESFDAPKSDAPVLARRFVDLAGLPTRMGWIDLVGETPSLAVKIEGTTTTTQLTRLVNLSGSNDLLDVILPRRVVALLSEATASAAIAYLKPALIEALRRAEAVPAGGDGWQMRDAWSSRASRCAELVSRLCVRLPEAEVSTVVSEALELGRTLRLTNWGFYKPLSNLLDRSIRALPSSAREKFLLGAVELPLPGERIGDGHEHDWPELIYAFRDPTPLDRAAAPVAWSNRIHTLIARAGDSESIERERAIQRLAKIHEWGGLEPTEATAFASAYWARRKSNDGLPECTGLHDHMALCLPEPQPGLAAAVFHKSVIEKPLRGPPDHNDYVALANAARHIPEAARISLSRDEAKLWLGALLQNRVSNSLRGRGADRAFRPDQTALGWALTHGIAPFLARDDVDDVSFARLLAEDSPWSLLIGLPALLALRTDRIAEVAARFREALGEGDADAWVSAANGLVEWSRLEQENRSPQAPADLYSEIASTVLARRSDVLQQALWTASRLVKDQRFSALDLRRLDFALGYMAVEFVYGSEAAESIQHLSQIRQACVGLAIQIQATGRISAASSAWIEQAANDPLPDVREALNSPDDWNGEP